MNPRRNAISSGHAIFMPCRSSSVCTKVEASIRDLKVPCPTRRSHGPCVRREPTLYAWVQKGRLGSRLVRVGARHTILVHADDATVASLKAIRTTPLPWRRLPPPNQSTPPSPLTEF